MDEINEISSTATIKNRFSNKMFGSFQLYRPNDYDTEAELTVKQGTDADLRSTITIKVQRNSDLNSTISIVYRDESPLFGSIDAIAVNFMEGLIEIRPHNRMIGKFELLQAPRITVALPPFADATTRSREDLRTINYGDTRTILTGKSSEEVFGAFVQFEDFKTSIPDLKFIESAKLRLYYSNLNSESNIELHQPNTFWREMGITDANKPYSVAMLSNRFSINNVQRYIEFDIKDIAQRWQDGTLDNYGFIISTTDDTRYTFYTRESDYPPQLIVEYITSQVYSIGRSELESGLFIYGRGISERTGTLTVKSTFSTEPPLESIIYIHRAEDFLACDQIGLLTISKPELNGRLTVSIADKYDFESEITVAVNAVSERDSLVSVNQPDLNSIITVDPKISLPGYLTVQKYTESPLDSVISISRPDLCGTINVSNYKKDVHVTEGYLTVRNGYEENFESLLSVSRREISGKFVIRTNDDYDFLGLIQVPSKYDTTSYINVSRPELSAQLTVKHHSSMDGFITVKSREFLNAQIDIKNISEMSGELIAKVINQLDGAIKISNPDLFGLLSPRVIGEEILPAIVQIKKRNVSDVNCYISVRGQGNRNFVIIF